ncbi:hypothetical protein, partial [Agathobacter rectalis]|uniref:hypothetical protein n=1 Tax=Agathobacter rectalis TaxID=39491 RepID=UPI0027D7DD4D
RAIILTLLLKLAKPLSRLSSCCISPLQIPIEQNRCAMACQGCGAVLFLLKSSGITFHNPLLLSYHTKQLN